jgi:hypothetical protein
MIWLTTSHHFRNSGFNSPITVIDGHVIDGVHELHHQCRRCKHSLVGSSGDMATFTLSGGGINLWNVWAPNGAVLTNGSLMVNGAMRLNFWPFSGALTTTP